MAMDFQTGIDIEEIARFRQKEFAKNTRFYERIFSAKEIEYCNKRFDPYVHFAGKFAAKEAISKALNGIGRLPFFEIEIGNHKDGSPCAHIPKKYREKISAIQISISHTKDIATAVAVTVWNKKGTK